MINRIAAWPEHPADDEEVPYGDFVVVSGTFGAVFVSLDEARRIERALDALRPPRWIAFRDRAGSRIRVRTGEIRAFAESTAEQRAVDRRLDRARRLEELGARRPWEDEL
jgi:hypothetical protein